jgi:raffinose/stachyose/melibiose transport system permease protein
MFGRQSTRSAALTTTVAMLVAAAFALPLLFVLRYSLEGEGLGNYGAVLADTPFVRNLLNSATISAGVVAAVVVTTSLAAFAFSKLEIRGKRLLFASLIVGLTMPTIALLVPLFVTVQRLGLFNSHLSVILPLAAVTTPFTLLLMRNYIDGIPDEIIDASRIDGCTNLQTLRLVVLPLCRPILAVVVVWSFLQSWNEFFLPLLLLQSEERQTLTQIPLYFTSVYGSDTPKIFASLVLISLPVVAAYLSMQRLFERGLTAGALKS